VAAGGAQAGGFEGVLEGNGDAGQRATDQPRVNLAGGGQGLFGVEGDEGVERRVAGLDRRQGALGQFFAGAFTGGDGLGEGSGGLEAVVQWPASAQVVPPGRPG